MPVRFSCAAIYRYGHCLFSCQSSAHAAECTAQQQRLNTPPRSTHPPVHSFPPPPYSKIGLKFSSWLSAFRGVAIRHSWSKASVLLTCTRSHSTQPCSEHNKQLRQCCTQTQALFSVSSRVCSSLESIFSVAISYSQAEGLICTFRGAYLHRCVHPVTQKREPTCRAHRSQPAASHCS